jgi:hypothetical protein
VKWWVVTAGSALLSWIFLLATEHFEARRWDTCEVSASPHPDAVGCSIVHIFETYNLELGWLIGLAYLVLCAAIYGVITFIRRRRIAA